MKLNEKILCTRLLQVLDSEDRFGVPYGSLSPFHFGFRDIAFSHPGSRSYNEYMNLRSYRNIKEYRKAVIELYKDDYVDLEVNGESRKFPIQIIQIPREDQEKLAIAAQNQEHKELLQQDMDWIFISSLPSPRLLGNPPTGKSRSDYLNRPKTNKVIDIAIMVPLESKEEGKKLLALEISKYLASVEQTIHFASKTATNLKNAISKHIGISMRGTNVDNPAIYYESFRVPCSNMNFLELPKPNIWPTLDIDLDIFCSEEDFAEIYQILQDENLFFDVNAEVKGLRVQEASPKQLFFKDQSLRSIDIFLMTEEWVMQSVQRHLNQGFEQPWAYYYFTSYPMIFDDWQSFLTSLAQHIFH